MIVTAFTIGSLIFSCASLAYVIRDGLRIRKLNAEASAHIARTRAALEGTDATIARTRAILDNAKERQ